MATSRFRLGCVALLAGLVAPGVAGAQDRAGDDPAELSHDAAEDGRAAELLGTLSGGEPFHAGWRVARSFATAGGLTLVLQQTEDDRAPVRVDVVRRVGQPLGPASTEYLDLIVMTGVLGESITGCSIDEALQSLVQQIAGPDVQRRLASGLLTHEQRVRIYPDRMLSMQIPQDIEMVLAADEGLRLAGD